MDNSNFLLGVSFMNFGWRLRLGRSSYEKLRYGCSDVIKVFDSIQWVNPRAGTLSDFENQRTRQRSRVNLCLASFARDM